MVKWCVYLAIEIGTGEIVIDKGAFPSLANAVNYIAFCLRFGTPINVKLQRLPVNVPLIVPLIMKVPKVK